MKNYYQILGIERTSNTNDIKSAYRKLALKFHPDKNNGDKFFEDRFKEIQEAYETLSDEKKKYLYDIEYDLFFNIKSRKSDNNRNEYDDFKNENLKKEQKESQESFIKLEELEKKVKKVKDKYELLTVGINKKITQISLMISEMKGIEERTNKKIVNVADDIKAKDILITRIEEEIGIKGSKISDLEDVLEYRKTQIEKKKANS